MKISGLTATALLLPATLATTLRGGVEQSGLEGEWNAQEALPALATENDRDLFSHPVTVYPNSDTNDYQHSCSHSQGKGHFIWRPHEDDFINPVVWATCHKPWDHTPKFWVAGTTDPSCPWDTIEKCEVDGKKVKCFLSIAPMGYYGGCNQKKVDVNIHILCC